MLIPRDLWGESTDKPLYLVRMETSGWWFFLGEEPSTGTFSEHTRVSKAVPVADRAAAAADDLCVWVARDALSRGVTLADISANNPRLPRMRGDRPTPEGEQHESGRGSQADAGQGDRIGDIDTPAQPGADGDQGGREWAGRGGPGSGDDRGNSRGDEKQDPVAESGVGTGWSATEVDGEGSPEGAGKAAQESGADWPWKEPLTPEVLAEWRGAKTKARDNLLAIDTLLAVESREDPPTPAERGRLARYVGWGGIPSAFRRPNGEIAPGWADIVEGLESRLSPAEIAQAARSTLDAHYTSHTIIDAMWKGVAATGLEPGAVLEPASGPGHFIGHGPRDTQYIAVEIDPITARIAKALYPEARGCHVFNVPFEQFASLDGQIDLVIGNPPFGPQKVFDPNNAQWSKAPNIHSYFIEKSLAQVKPGGIVAFVVSRFFLDAKTYADHRERLARQAELIEAVRLPNTAFKQNAGTEVVTDILFFQRRLEPVAEDAPGFVPPYWVEADRVVPGAEPGYRANGWYAQHPEKILGRPALIRGMYEENEPSVLPVDGWQDRLVDLMSGIRPVFDLGRPCDYIQLDPGCEEDISDYPDNTLLVLTDKHTGEVFPAVRASYVAAGFQKLPVKREGMGESSADEGAPDAHHAHHAHHAHAWSEAEITRLAAYTELRDTLATLLDLQVSRPADDAETEQVRERLNERYAAFTKRYGLIHRQINRRLFQIDPMFSGMLALEVDYDRGVSRDVAKRTGEAPRKESAKLATIFTRRTQFPVSEVESAPDAESALMASLGRFGDIRPDHMTRLAGQDWQTLREALGNRVVLTPEGDYRLAAEYASGDVVSRLEEVQAWADSLAEGSLEREEAGRTVAVLKAAQPEFKRIGEFDILPTASWMPVEINAQFAHEHLSPEIRVQYIKAVGTWTVDGPSSVRNSGSPYVTDRVDGRQMMRLLLTSGQPVVYDKGDDGESVLNEAATELARARLNELRGAWHEWIVADPTRVERIEIAFNAALNRFVRPNFSGMHLTFPGKSADVVARPHQKEVVWYGLQNKSVLMDHSVGAGKTYAALLLAAEAKRLGRASKPMFAVPNHLITQWQEAAATLYPNSRVLAATPDDLSKKKRQEFLGRVAYGDWDLVIIPHSSFTLIPRDPAFDQKWLDREIDRLREALLSVKEGADKRTRKQIERKIERAKARQQDLIKRTKSGDEGLHLGNIGVDFLCVDESHEFKNVPFETGLRNVSGLGNPEGSARAEDMLIKARSIAERGGYLVFLSGTPEANSLAEVYLQQRYMQPDVLRQMGLNSFDAWAGAFAAVNRDYVFTLTGAFKEKAILNRFVNMDVLRQVISGFRHSITKEESEEMMRRDGIPVRPRPRVRNGKPKIVSVEKTPLQSRLIGEQVDTTEDGSPVWAEGSILWQVENLPKKPKAGDPNILTCISDMGKVSLSAHALLKGAAPADEPSPKLEAVASEIVDLYREWDHERGTQLVYLDSSTPKKPGRVSAEARQVQEWVWLVDHVDTDSASADDLAAIEAAEEGLAKYSPSEIEAFLEEGDSDAWSAYVETRRLLVDRGIPETEIAFIHDYDTPEKKADLFGKIRSGYIRVAMGSTAKMGPGMNVQNRLVGIHMIDAPWRPSDMEQRLGRILREGNELAEKYEDFEVAVNYYVTKDTGDAGKFQILDNKKTFMDQIRCKDGARAIDDPDAAAFDPQAIIAAASGNELLQDRVILSSKVKQLDALARGTHAAHAAWLRDTQWLSGEVKRFTEQRPSLERQSERVADAVRRMDADRERHEADVEAARAARDAERQKPKEEQDESKMKVPSSQAWINLTWIKDGQERVEQGVSYEALGEAVQEAYALARGRTRGEFPIVRIHGLEVGVCIKDSRDGPLRHTYVRDGDEVFTTPPSNGLTANAWGASTIRAIRKWGEDLRSELSYGAQRIERLASLENTKPAPFGLAAEQAWLKEVEAGVTALLKMGARTWEAGLARIDYYTAPFDADNPRKEDAATHAAWAALLGPTVPAIKTWQARRAEFRQALQDDAFKALGCGHPLAPAPAESLVLPDEADEVEGAGAGGVRHHDHAHRRISASP